MNNRLPVVQIFYVINLLVNLSFPCVIKFLNSISRCECYQDDQSAANRQASDRNISCTRIRWWWWWCCEHR